MTLKVTFALFLCRFLGTASGAPNTKANVTSHVVHVVGPEGSEQWMLDCGEGV